MRVRSPLVLLTARGGTNLCCFWFLSAFVFTGAQTLARTHFARWMKGQRSGSGSTLKAAFHVSKRGALIGGQTPGLLGLPYSLRRTRGKSFREQQYPQVTLTRWPRMLFCWVWLLTPERSWGTLSVHIEVLSNIEIRFALTFSQVFFVCTGKWWWTHQHLQSQQKKWFWKSAPLLWFFTPTQRELTEMHLMTLIEM